ncbi:MAG TPA: tetratricopeptide repeat protein [Gemmatimonadaceae bacterium]|nr:tetratricopeptide repeat protein [Gemmatimonadaceae bacterium]
MILAFDRLRCALRAAARPSPTWRAAFAAAMAGRAFHALDRGDVAAAEARSLYALEIEPTQGDAIASLAAALDRRGNAERATELFDRAAASGDLGARALAGLADRAFARGDLAGAEQLCARALERDGEQPLAHLTRGRVLASRGDFGAAVEALARGARGTNDAMAWTQLGVVQRQVGRPADARASFERAIARDPGLTEAHISLGELFASAGMVDRARASLAEALRSDPQSVRARTRLAGVAMQGGAADEAERLLRETRDIAPGDVDALVLLGDLQRGAGRLDEALDSYRRALAIDPIDVRAHLGRAHALLERGDVAAGREEYEWRLRNPSLERLLSSRTPVWRGESLEGRSIFVQFEPGIEENSEALRLLPALVAMKARVTVEAVPPLEAPLASIPGVAIVPAGSSEAQRVRDASDFRVPILSLPHRLGAAGSARSA